MTDLSALAEIVDEAARNATEVEQLTVANPSLTPAEAYRVQALSIDRRLARGEKLVGLKMGLTSRAKMQQVNVSEVIAGRLTDFMQIVEGGELSLDRFIHPRVEPEIAFILNRPLSGRITATEGAAAIEAVAPALEIIDSRYRDFKFKLADVVADNSSSSGFVIGPPSPAGTDIANLGIVLSFNGRPVQIGSAAAILGHPLRALVEAARMAETYGYSLKAGDIVLAGAATAAEPLRSGIYVSAEIRGLGGLGFAVR
jgi:2-oxo-3-hexenedioate decarboxylase